HQPGPQQASGPVLVVSASASSTTAAQIGDALAHGWADVAVPVGLLQQHDPRYAAAGPVDPHHVGGLLGSLVAHMTAAELTRDVAVLGGDTSSHALIA